MFQIKVKADFSAVRALVEGHARQLPFATALALTRTAWSVAGSETVEVGKVFDRPKPQTMKSFRVDKATKENLTAVVSIRSREQGLPADEYLTPNIGGGKRAMKRSEIMLRAAGILPPGMQTAPGAGAQLDAFGNMSRGQIAQILSYFKTYGVTTLNSPRMNMTAAKAARLKRTKSYFVVAVDGRKTKLAPGIWLRDSSGAIKPILMFIKPPSYGKRFNFTQVAEKQVQESFNTEFDRAFADAVRTAR